MYGWIGDKIDDLNPVLFVDSDFASCRLTRKSTSGGAIVLGSHLLKHWAKTQPTIALSSGEAELAAVVKGSTELLGIRAIFDDFRLEEVDELMVESDATAALGIVKREGLGKVRHLAVADLWVQQRAKKRDILYRKVKGQDNPSDLLTKHKAPTALKYLLSRVDTAIWGGRARLAPVRT